MTVLPAATDGQAVILVGKIRSPLDLTACLKENRRGGVCLGCSGKMRDMQSTFRWGLTTFALAVIAVGLHLSALAQFGRGAQQRARAVNAAARERTVLAGEASKFLSRGVVIGGIGLAFAVASFGGVVAMRRDERFVRFSTLLVLLVYVILQFLSV
jgi:hypothetical protein